MNMNQSSKMRRSLRIEWYDNCLGDILDLEASARYSVRRLLPLLPPLSPQSSSFSSSQSLPLVLVLFQDFGLLVRLL